MPEVRYGGRNGERLQLEVDPELMAVRTRSRRSFRDGPVAGPEAALLDGMELVLEFPEVGVEVYRRRGGAEPPVAEVKEALEQAPDTRLSYGHPALGNAWTALPVAFDADNPRIERLSGWKTATAAKITKAYLEKDYGRARDQLMRSRYSAYTVGDLDHRRAARHRGR